MRAKAESSAFDSSRTLMTLLGMVGPSISVLLGAHEGGRTRTRWIHFSEPIIALASRNSTVASASSICWTSSLGLMLPKFVR